MAPIIRMRSKISGTRDGIDWPAPGETLEVPNAEAAQLVAGGQAVLADQPETADAPTGKVETATVPAMTVAQVRAAAKAQQEEANRLAEEEKVKAEAAEAERLEAEAKAAKEAKK